jgi:hypothetical protein
MRVSPSFLRKQIAGVVLLSLLGGGFLVGMGGYAFGQASDFVEQRTIWADGEVAQSASVGGEVTTRRFVFKSYKLDVEWVDDQDRDRRGKLEFTTVFGGPERGDPVVVRYDPKRPKKFALSWAVESTVSWGIWVLLAIGLAVGFGGLLLFLAWTCLQNIRSARRAAVGGREVVAKIVAVEQQIVNGRPTGNQVYRYQLEGQKPREWIQVQQGPGPLFVDGERTSLLVIETDAAPVVVRADLHPFEVDPAAKDAVARTLGERGAPPPL